MTAELRDDFFVCTAHVTSGTICILHRTIQNSFDGIQFQTSVPLKRKSSGGSRYWGLWLLKHASMDSGTTGWNGLTLFILWSSSTLSHTCLRFTCALLYSSSFHGNDFPSLLLLFFFSSHLVILLTAIILLRTFSLLFFSSSALHFTSFTFRLILLVFSFFTFSYCSFSHSYSLHDIVSFFFHKCPDLQQQVTHCLSHLCSQYTVQRHATTSDWEKHHSK
jgi:hypothetical protein